MVTGSGGMVRELEAIIERVGFERQQRWHVCENLLFLYPCEFYEPNVVTRYGFFEPPAICCISHSWKRTS